MKYLVTGGAGFIGSHLVHKLLEESDNNVTVLDGHSDKIIVIDNMYEGKYENLPNDPRLTVYNADILGDIGHLFKDVDIVFHMAALTRPQWSIVHPFETNTVNVDGTLKVLEHCRDNSVYRIVFMSSSATYGDTIYPTPEGVVPHPISPYALSKQIGEQYCELFYKLFGLQYNAIRPFNVYGAGMNPNGIYSSAVAKFIDSIYRDETVNITGHGDQARDFVYVDDVVDQLILMAHSAIHGQAFNCGSGTNTSINDLMKMIARLLGKEITPNHTVPVIEPEQTLADISKAERLLKWKPKVSLEEGLRRTIDGTLKKYA